MDNVVPLNAPRAGIDIDQLREILAPAFARQDRKVIARVIALAAAIVLGTAGLSVGLCVLH